LRLQPVANAGTFALRREFRSKTKIGLGMMTRDTAHRLDSLSPEIRRQLRGEPMRRYVRSFSSFAVKPDIPKNLRDLLDRLDDAEKASKAGKSKSNGRS
jgi:hypothetical protein